MAVKFIKTPPHILNASEGVHKNLHNIYYNRYVRRVISVLIRSPLRVKILRLVNFTIPLPANSGCIILTCHSPWKRLLVQWCLENNFGLFIAAGRWKNRRSIIQKNGAGFSELRTIIKYLQSNGRIIIAADVFNNLNNCPVNFFEQNYNASLLPARLAKIAEVPIIVAIPVLQKGRICIESRTETNFNPLTFNPCNTMQHFISYFEKEIKINPCAYDSFVK